MPVNVLFLCTHNSARSVLAEATLNHIGKGRFRAFSAGSSPRPNQRPHPMALRVLEEAGIPTDGVRSKSWDEFAADGAPNMDLVVTVCDNAAGEACPFWPGRPATAHWGYADPSETKGDEEAVHRAFRSTLLEIRRRLDLLSNLPPEAIEKMALEASARGLSGS